MFYYSKRRRVTVDCGTEMVTKQSHKDECDIHKILNQYKKTGIISHITSHQGLYLDLPDNIDYQAAIALVRDADDAFASLPSSVRDKYNNDPERFLQAVFDPSQRSELEALGVFEPKKAPSPASSSSSSEVPKIDSQGSA